MLRERMLRTNKTEAQHVAYKKCPKKPIKTFCMPVTHKPQAPRAFRAEREPSPELLESSRAKNSLLVRAQAEHEQGVLLEAVSRA
jgi:hypothetical protein